MGKLRKNVGEIGEFPLIDRIRKILPVSRNKDLLVDIGDDTAVIRMDERRALLVTCDIQVEGRHFRLDRTTPYQVGRRAMAVNLSDIASMGGKPTYALVSLGLPADFPVESYDRLFEGMRDELLPHRACIIGGNLARTEECLIVDVTLLGEADPSRVLTRGGARAGDRIFVTGHLGASGAGFQALKAFGKKVPGRYREMVSRHVLPVPRVDLGRRISRSGVASAMIDLSDGVAGDLHHVCTRSGVGAEIHEDQLPLPERIGEIAEEIRHVGPGTCLAQRRGLRTALHRSPRGIGEEDPIPPRRFGDSGHGNREDREAGGRVLPGGLPREEKTADSRRLGPFPDDEG